MATLVIEGANFTGKSTLIKELEGKYPVYRGLKGLPKETITRHEMSNIISSDFYAADFINQTKTNVILERSVMSACVYQQVPIQYFKEFLGVLEGRKLLLLLIESDSVLTSRMLDSGAQDRLKERNLSESDVLRNGRRYLQIAKEIEDDAEVVLISPSIIPFKSIKEIITDFMEK